MIIKNISCPDDLKRIAPNYLPEVCEHLRKTIIDTVSANGGHLAPSLGVVELTVALHYVFESPKDKLIWDVGHQAYAHKILTGRWDRFHTLRQKGGLSGFPNRKESPHDSFGTGHASTSISAAVGIAKAMKRMGRDDRAIAVIGDGSMTGGLAFEAINQAGNKVGNLVVVLNDNEMSISPNVGAISKFLSMHIHGRTVGRIRRKVKKFFLSIPVLGSILFKFSQKAEETTIGFFTPGYLFEAFGFDYIGPLDGHNIDEMIRVFSNVKNSPINDRPVIVHVLTKKGKGYLPAETNPVMFHGVGAFDKATGKPIGNGGESFTKAAGNSLLRVAKENKNVLAITAAMASGTGLDAFATAHPDRFFDVGIAEGHAVTFAAGLATEGYRPVVAIYSTFLQRAYDNIVHDVCLQDLPVTFLIDRAGIVGDDGATHNGTFDLSFLRMIPKMTIVSPRSASMLDLMMTFAVGHNGPVAIRYPRGTAPTEVCENTSALELGAAQIVWKGADPSVVIIAVGHLVAEAFHASEMLAQEGINAIVVDPIFIKPFDKAMFRELIKSCPNLITVEENVLSGGFGSSIGEWLASEGLMENVRLRNIALPDCFVEHASQSELRALYHLDANGIFNEVNEFLGERACEAICEPRSVPLVRHPREEVVS